MMIASIFSLQKTTWFSIRNYFKFTYYEIIAKCLLFNRIIGTIQTVNLSFKFIIITLATKTRAIHSVKYALILR